MATTQTSNITATELLRTQHQQVKQMFSELRGAKGDHRSQVFDCLRATLAVHETAEEMIVHPEARASGDEGKGIVEARLKEESEAKTMLSDLEKMGVDGDKFDETLRTFEAAVLRHAEAEEGQLFPLLERTCDAQKLRDMAAAIEVAEKLAPTHPHPHGPESAIGNMLVGPFVGMVDKVRDKLSGHEAKPST